MKSVLTKLNRKLDQFKRGFIPFNLKYRPEGFEADSLTYFEKTKGKYFDHIPLIERRAIQLPMNKALKKVLFEPTVVDHFDSQTFSYHSTTEAFVNIIPQGRLYSDNLYMVWIISGNNRLLGDCSFQFDNGYPVDPNKRLLIQQNYFKPPLHIYGTVCSLLNGGGGVNNFYHWMIDVVPRLHLLKKAGWLKRTDYFVVPNFNTEFQKSTLSRFGITADQLIVCQSTLHLQADRLISTSHPRHYKSLLVPDWVAAFHRNCFLSALKGTEPTAEKLYISRQDSSFRPIYNEEALIEYMRSKGFAIVVLSELTLMEKIRYFYQARVIVGATGAGFTPLLFSQPGTKLLEIFGRDMTHIHYYNISYLTRIEYHFVVCEKDNPPLKTRKQSVSCGFMADLELIARKVEQLI